MSYKLTCNCSWLEISARSRRLKSWIWFPRSSTNGYRNVNRLVESVNKLLTSASNMGWVPLRSRATRRVLVFPEIDTKSMTGGSKGRDLDTLEKLERGTRAWTFCAFPPELEKDEREWGIGTNDSFPDAERAIKVAGEESEGMIATLRTVESREIEAIGLLFVRISSTSQM